MTLRIFLEGTTVDLSLGLAGHMYLVLRDVEVDADGNVIGNVIKNEKKSAR